MKNRASGTAEGIAYLRDYESRRPVESRICEDTLAYRLVAWWVKFAVAITRPFPMSFMDWAFEKKGVGVSGFIAVRTRIFDDFVLQAAQAGCKQFVILGAGLDTRAYRFKDQLAGIQIFEVDHPASQAVKKQRLARVLGSLPNEVHYVPVDFTRDDLLTCLVRDGYDPGLPTVFTLEGVIEYLPEPSVRETLTLIVEHAGAGSRVMFDYVLAAALDGRIRNRVIRHMNSLKFIFHEPVLFGIESGTAEDFLLDLGYTRAEDFPPLKLHDLYLKPKVPERAISDCYAVVAGYR